MAGERRDNEVRTLREDFKQETDHAHRRIDDLADSMHQGFTDLRKDLSRDKNDIMKAINEKKDILSNDNGDSKPQEYKTTLTLAITLFITVIFSLGAILQIQIAATQDYQEKLQNHLDKKNNTEHFNLRQDTQVEADEILRIRAWKDQMEQKIPELRKDINWLKMYIGAEQEGYDE